jgi:hypothetical protein
MLTPSSILRFGQREMDSLDKQANIEKVDRGNALNNSKGSATFRLENIH